MGFFILFLFLSTGFLPTVGKIDFSIYSQIFFGFLCCLRNYVTAQPTDPEFQTQFWVCRPTPLIRAYSTLCLRWRCPPVRPCVCPLLALSSLCLPFFQLHKCRYTCYHLISKPFKCFHTADFLDESLLPLPPWPPTRLANPLRIRRTHFDILTIIFCASLLHFSKRIRIACSIFNNTLCAFWLLLVLFSLLWTRTGTHTHAQCDKCASKMCLLTVFVVMSHPLLYTYSGHCNFDTAFKYNVLYILDHVHRVNLV